MAIKKSELYSSLWKSCDELRGGMDASQYKDYILVLLFVKYVSDKYAGVADALIEVPAGGSFQDIVNLKGNKDIGDGINKIIAKLAEANDLVGIITVADFNDADKLGKGKEMQDRLTKLVGIFQNPALNFSRNRADGDDILGDAYEYLMRNFATQSGKSKGQFYTPRTSPFKVTNEDTLFQCYHLESSCHSTPGLYSTLPPDWWKVTPRKLSIPCGLSTLTRLRESPPLRGKLRQLDI